MIVSNQIKSYMVILAVMGGILLISPVTQAQSVVPDCNNNGIPDHIDISDGMSQDCNQNGFYIFPPVTSPRLMDVFFR